MKPIELLKKSLTARFVIVFPDGGEFACLSIVRGLQDTAVLGAVGRIGKWHYDKDLEYVTWSNLTHKALSEFEGAKIDKRSFPEASSDKEELERYMRENALEPVE